MRIGRYIKAFVQEKSEEGQDATWWKRDLWVFIRKSVPRESQTLTLEKLEQSYERLERLERERLAQLPPARGTALNPIVIS